MIVYANIMRTKILVSRMKVFVYLFGFVMLLASCTSSKKEWENARASIDFGQCESVEPIDVFSTSFVKLETADDCLIASITQAEEYGGVFYLLDAFITRTVYAFDKQGKFIGTVGRKGKGPGEYVIPSSFFIDARLGAVCVIDVEQQKLMGYSLKDYRLAFEHKLPFSSMSMRFMDDGTAVLYNQEYKSDEPLYNLIVVDKDFKIKKRMMEQEFASGYKMGMTRKLYSVGNVVSAYTHQSPYLCRVNSDTIVPVYEFKFGDYRLPPLDFLQKEGSNNRNYIPALRESGYINYYEVYENERMLCVPYYVDKTMFYGWYDKKRSKTYNYRLDEMTSSLKSGPFSTPIGTTSDGNFISLLSTEQLMSMKENGMDFVEELERLISQSKEDDNPILLLLKEK